MLIRPATHAGSWYSAEPATLQRQIAAFFAHAPGTVPGARILIGPHAGYAYCGERLAETYNAWDPLLTKRVFVLGPSHHAYLRDGGMLSPFASYDTPLGNVPVDVSVNQKLARLDAFRTMPSDVDEEEHLFEMHLPFLVHKCRVANVPVPQIVPIMISGLLEACRDSIVQALLPYINDPLNTFAVLSDFCHWGSRFGYTEYVPRGIVDDVQSYSKAADHLMPIYKSIEVLDRAAMDIASSGSVEQWDRYIMATGNTICGRKPMSIMLALMEAFLAKSESPGFEWLGYSQSNAVEHPSDLSVSYASGYAAL